MREYLTRIDIAAPPARVWEVLTDFQAYPEWNPLIGSVEGIAALDQRVTVEVTPLSRSYRVRIVAWEPPRKLAWRGWEILPVLFTGTHYFRLDPRPGGGTRLHHGERFTGWLSVLLRDSLLERMHQAFTHHDLILKQRVEERMR